jgi:hypothetical protein
VENSIGVVVVQPDGEISLSRSDASDIKVW